MSTKPEGFAYPSMDTTSAGITLREAGLTAREHAAIALRVPDSGNEWLDKMIRTAQRNDLAARVTAAAITAHISHYGHDNYWPPKDIVDYAREVAEAVFSGPAAQKEQP